MFSDANYLDSQYQVNNRHRDGSVEAPHEEAIGHAKTFAKWVKDSGLPCESILDAGCRTGYGMDALAEHFPAARIVGCDIVPQFIEVAEKRGEAHVADMHRLPYEDGEFDWVFCCTAFEHCHDEAKAAAELRRVSKVGFYILTDLEDEKRFNLNPSHYTHHNDPAEWIQVFAHPEFWCMKMDVPRYSRIEMTWVRRPLVADFKKDQDAWR